MTVNEIIKGNKLIAEFMGGVYHSKLFPVGTRQIWVPIHGMYEQNKLKYHSSRDWLMPVIDKTKCLLIEEYTLIDRIDDALICVELEDVYCAVVAFIEWYNQQPK
jgi:hypothetical protein